ncbi:MAG TPA: hypothetical protein VFV50_13035 [Bdellovibrionales bacterium]|nr:hypothetical protein [Bdellovibrionales bacterium]
MKQFAALVLLTLTISTNALAVERTVQAEYDPSTRHLSLLIEDAQESSRACDYHVQSMAYYSKHRLVSLQLAEETCLTEVIGKKKAMFTWHLPRALHMNDFCLRVNSKKIARITLEADRAVVTQGCN